jgi:glycerophosphoryl diester phosphodiesterase
LPKRVFLNLEIKDPRIDLAFPLITDLIEEFDLFDQISLSSFRHEYYDKVLQYNDHNNRNIIFGNLYPGKRTNFNFSRRGSALNIFWKDANKAICDKAHKNGMAVLVYFKDSDVESHKIYTELINYGVDVICSNYPVLAKTFRDNYYIKSKINKILFQAIKNIKRFLMNYSIL